MKQVLARSVAYAMDGTMCAMMNALQWRLGAQTCSYDQFENYLRACSGISREDFYRMPPISAPRYRADQLEWRSSTPSGFSRNDQVCIKVYPCAEGPTAPTVLILHALMSASDIGYRKLAAWFNARGWNAVFPHLPFHYTRKPPGYFNGELAISANLVRNAETLRQGVIELRQFMNLQRARGCQEFGLIGTSYGGWTGALLSFLEADFRFMALIQPIVNVEHAIWENPGSASMRSLLRARGIKPGEIERHAHLSSPLHGLPLCGAERTILTSGHYDRVAPARELRELHRRWKGSTLLHVKQGHFGYAALRETLKEVERFV